MRERGLLPAFQGRIAQRDELRPTGDTDTRESGHGQEPRSEGAETDSKAEGQTLREALEPVSTRVKRPDHPTPSAEKWPVVQALVGDEVWKNGIGHLLIARREPDGGLVFAVFLVDVYCLGVKNAFWHTGTSADIDDLVKKLAKFETMSATTPACLAKIVKGAIEYAQSFGFPPHPDYRHAAMLLDGIDPSSCPTEFRFGRDGRPFYVQGPNETPAQADAIRRIVTDVGGHFLVALSADEVNELRRSKS